MLRKLLKYDLQYTLRFLWPFYFIGIFFAIVSRFSNTLDKTNFTIFLTSFCGGVTISMIFNAIINNIIFVWRRFTSTLYGDAGYLYHTLPITKTTQYLTRIISLVASQFLSVAVSVIMLLIAFYSKENLELIKAFLEPIAAAFSSNILVIIAVLAVLIFLQLINITQCGLSGIILGHRMGSNKIGFSFLFGFITYCISQTITLTLTVIYGTLDKNVLEIFTSAALPEVGALKTVVALCIVLYALITPAICFVNVKLLKRGVNVD